MGENEDVGELERQIERERRLASPVEALGLRLRWSGIHRQGNPLLAAPRSPNPQHTHRNLPAKPDRTAYPGTYAQVSLEMNQRPDGLTVPAAVGSDGDGNFVSTMTNNRLTRLAIKTGLTDNGRIEVTAGLSENALVVANPRACQR